MRQMKTSEKPRDVSGVELLMNNHQGHKAEIDARADNFKWVEFSWNQTKNLSSYFSLMEEIMSLFNSR